MMLDHVSIAVSDMRRSLAFYARALVPLGIERLTSYGGEDDDPDHVGFGRDHKPFLWLRRGEPGEVRSHIALAALDGAIVDAFHDAALEAGGLDNGPPGVRPQYHARYYGAFVLDPASYNLEAVHHGL